MDLITIFKANKHHPGRTTYSGICLQCKNLFYCQNIGYKHNQIFCSRQCAGKSFIGENNTRWKGGLWTNKQGYNIVQINGKKLREHRHIMEQHIGRKLKPSENVHHKNGIRNDNRIENLELWCEVRQLPGQRISDLIEFICTNYRKEVIGYINKQTTH